MNTLTPCPCGTGHLLASCCHRYHAGEPAPDAVSLMRSRYTAYVLQNSAYLKRTWHPRTCPRSLDLADGPRWSKLEILDHGGNRRKAWVEFIAHYNGGQLHEKSRFAYEQGAWVYVDGTILDS
ncbi:hypothetical protein CAI21_18390 [Alkalilimnicola ehrlichii]|uniref:YchJ-like middle NTF2-like domain-containing protein n=1 Tax=Alkalilimnicola ehrlichii TaxID=351052 RepID=A0A3E0WKZ7_9GAMM|nr:YchJ family metal-binding protein [Alkalilimnicola ehrlichii]RFA25738.1 hypothetical protein CAI21_18390 [Alkalilimnicola ehrlichii]RFA32821.1 hypothetical protein CAL65_18640 [Alkalilimnicola ehrlichii]